jgi:hypothetical protein
MKKIFQKIKAGFNKCFGGGTRNNSADGVGNEVTAMPQSQIDKERHKRAKKGMSAQPGAGAEKNNPDLKSPPTDKEVDTAK